MEGPKILAKPEEVKHYAVTITRFDSRRIPTNKRVMLNEQMTKDLIAGKRVIIEIEDGEFLHAAAKEKDGKTQ